MCEPPQKKEIGKIWQKNDEPQINQYTLFIVHLNFDRLLTQHEKIL